LVSQVFQFPIYFGFGVGPGIFLKQVDGESLSIKVNCRADGQKIVTPIRYGLAVTLEVQEGIQINVYDAIRSRITVPVETEI